MDIEKALKTTGDWISKETGSRKYPKGELLELSESLQALKAEIERQSATSEEVESAIDWLETGDFEIIAGDEEYTANSSHHPNTSRFRKTAITALQAYQPISSKTEKVEPCWYCAGIESHGIATIKTVTDEYGCELGAYDTPYNFCPNCGRKFKED